MKKVDELASFAVDYCGLTPSSSCLSAWLGNVLEQLEMGALANATLRDLVNVAHSGIQVYL